MSFKSLQRAQIPVDNVDRFCPEHKSEILFSCKDCDGVLVCRECITSYHQRHAFDKVEDVAAKEIEVIKTFVDKVEQRDLPKLNENIATVDEQIQENSKHSERIVEGIKSQGDELKRIIDEITDDLSSCCKDSENKNHGLLMGRSEEFKNIRDTLSNKLQHCKEVINSNNDILVIDTARDVKVKKPIKPRPPPILDKLTFVPKEIKADEISNLFGITSIKESPAQDCLMRDRDSEYHHKDENNFENHIQESVVMSSFKHTSFITSVQKSSTNSFWISSHSYDYTSLVNTTGLIQMTVIFESNVQDISVSHKTGNLWACCYNRNVYEVLTSKASRQPIRRFSTNLPISIAMTLQETVIIGTLNKVLLFSPSGQTLHTILNDTIIWPHHMAVCPCTGDIAICDGDLLKWGGYDKPLVIVMDKDLQVRYRYFGPSKSREETDRSKFRPVDVEYDDKGCLFVADHSMQLVHIQRIPNDGISFIDTGQDKPMALTLLDKGQLCLGFAEKIMKILQY